MRMVRGRRDARWLPSRYYLAMFRLAAFLRGRASEPQPADVILFVDRFQSTAEMFSVAIAALATATCYIAATLFRSWPVPAALAVSVPIALIALHLPFFALAPAVITLEPETRLRTQSAGMMLIFIALSAWFATSESWARFAAWVVLAFACVNAVAAIILVLLRDRVARFESSFGGTQSAL
jgi:hypothetical protein